MQPFFVIPPRASASDPAYQINYHLRIPTEHMPGFFWCAESRHVKHDCFQRAQLAHVLRMLFCTVADMVPYGVVQRAQFAHMATYGVVSICTASIHTFP